MIQIWYTLHRKQKIIKSEMSPLTNPEAETEAQLTDALTYICQKWDLERPMILSVHHHEYAQYGKAVFLRDHFLDDISFDRLELDRIEDDTDENRRT